MDLLLTHGFFLGEDEKELRIMKPYAPLGILYLASHLTARNLKVEVFDSTFSSREELECVLNTEKPAVLGIYANLLTRPSVLKILEVAKAAGWKTVVGGPEPGAYVEEYLASGADVVVIGEGELTLEEVVPALLSRNVSCLGEVRGIAFRGPNGKTVRTAPREQIANLDAQPWPLREAISMERYLQTWRLHHQTGSVSLITARGCPYDCRWCSHSVYGKTHRRRTPRLVVDELEWILNRYAPDMLWIADDVFTIHHGWLRGFSDEMQRRGLRIPFECISRADRLNAEAADLLAAMGCFRIWIGSESGSQRILDAMDRGVTVEQVAQATELCKSRGIQTGMFLMWGYEGEELQDIEATVRHVRHVQPDVFLTTVAYPIGGTPYFTDVADRISAPAVWHQRTDRDVRIRGRHSRRFYESADHLLKAEVELGRISNSGSPGDVARAVELEKAARVARDRLKSRFGETEA